MSYRLCLLWQDDISSFPEEPPNFKPPPPPSAPQTLDPSCAQHRLPGKDKPKRPSSESSQSGLFFVAPRNPSPPGNPPEKDTLSVTSTASTSTEDSAPSAIYATISPSPHGSRRLPDAQLSLLGQAPIGPFPRVQSPTRLKSPEGLQSPPSPSPPPPPAHPAPPPPDKGSPQAVNQHFIMVEVHQPNSEPDVNEVRPLPQARGGCQLEKTIPGVFGRDKWDRTHKVSGLVMDLMIQRLEHLSCGD